MLYDLCWRLFEDNYNSKKRNKMADEEVDLINRDPNHMNTFLQVDYEDVLAEPHGVHSTDW